MLTLKSSSMCSLNISCLSGMWVDDKFEGISYYPIVFSTGRFNYIYDTVYKSLHFHLNSNRKHYQESDSSPAGF